MPPEHPDYPEHPASPQPRRDHEHVENRENDNTPAADNESAAAETLQSERFDALLEHVLHHLPLQVKTLLDEVPVVVVDRPSPDILAEFGMQPSEAEELCGLHTGVAYTEQTVDGMPDMPSEIMLFRAGIIAEAGGWEQPDADALVREQIRITLLHEVGHQFGLDEDDLDRLGYA